MPNLYPRRSNKPRNGLTDFYHQQTIEREALLGYLHCLATGMDYKIRDAGERTSPDVGYTVTVDDGNGNQISGTYYPKSDVAETALVLMEQVICDSDDCDEVRATGLPLCEEHWEEEVIDTFGALYRTD